MEDDGMLYALKKNVVLSYRGLVDMDKRLFKANAKHKEVESEHERLISKIKDLMVKVNKSKTHYTKAEDEVSTLKASLEEAIKKLAESLEALKEKTFELEKKDADLSERLQKVYNEGHEDAKDYLRPQVRKSCYLAFVDGWVSALDALYVKAFSMLRNEEEMPILNNYLLKEPTTIEADMEEFLGEILEREKADGGVDAS
ncbi:hypothetical protein SO802_017565 [Lithocarpus litseifolius]|uniref:Uncharacterized protein n=1 Tax=Lithocarpus litseifolius TaxID=425828 RepID=A0AAW2CIJ0_9ROSI